FILQGKASLRYAEETVPLRADDFVYLAPGSSHAIANKSGKECRMIVMDFKIPGGVALSAPPSRPMLANLADVKEQTVGGHPSSVLYKLLIGPRGATRDKIDAAYVVTSLFLMHFAAGGTNFPHHHEFAEEIYLVLDGNGQMAAGGGMNGVEGLHPAKAGDAYYFRPNCTVGFYNAGEPGAGAHILAVRSLIPLPRRWN
ncbi:MAG: cupin domain-containing protein, partial [Terriglobia bacterium]